MAAFTRTNVTKWHDEVPGTRWFRADLHLHTLDDALGGNITWQAPPGLPKSDDPTDAATQAAYVRCFLQAAVGAGIDVLGLTPHSAHVPGSTGISVVWDIVDAWQNASDDDGTPFREKIYAVFPGFEPSASDGKGGIHLLVLFDPEIGKDRYLRAFSAVTGGLDVWHGGEHQTSPTDTDTLLGKLNDLKLREGTGWDFLCVAPHAFGDKGVVQSLKGSIGKYFAHGGIAALELKDNQVPQDALDAHEYLQAHLKQYWQPLIHSSDAYCLVNSGAAGQVHLVDNLRKRGIGYRHTLVKLASPRIESLRQAFLSSDSRVRVVYEKDAAGRLQYRKDIPKPVDVGRAWLRSVTVEGGTSFFGGKGQKQALRFSPDLTCIIGGRMTGKSTFLDGLRTYCGIGQPQPGLLADDVRERSGRFLSGNPTITLDIVGPIAATLPPRDRWPARFFTQRELGSIAKDSDNVRRILYHLAPAATADLLQQDKVIDGFDVRLRSLASTIASAHATLAEKEQAFATAEGARQALEAFREAGAAKLAAAQADLGRTTDVSQSVQKAARQLADTQALVSEIEAPTVVSLPDELSVLAMTAVDVKSRLELVSGFLDQAQGELTKLTEGYVAVAVSVNARVGELRANVQGYLVNQGRKADELNQFDALAELAANHESCRAAHEAAKTAMRKAEDEFASLEADRTTAVSSHREALEKIIGEVNVSIKTVRVSLSKAARRNPLEAWITALKDSGITRWWNATMSVTDPCVLYTALIEDRLSDVGMSAIVATRFSELMTTDRRYQLRAMRSDDECRIEAHVGPGEKDFRPIQKLSGGRQISVLLSLLLESSDTSPLIIDQPEDELDKAFFAETLLPILRRLKGRRQIIFATHDANLVVNGDADQVIHLEGDAESAHVKTQDAIDNGDIRQAVLTVLDGGKDAFDLRKRKYGF